MRPRIVGRIVLAVATVAFAVTALIAVIGTDEEGWHHGLEATALALLALTSATCYRYFED